MNLQPASNAPPPQHIHTHTYTHTHTLQLLSQGLFELHWAQCTGVSPLLPWEKMVEITCPSALMSHHPAHNKKGPVCVSCSVCEPCKVEERLKEMKQRREMAWDDALAPWQKEKSIPFAVCMYVCVYVFILRECALSYASVCLSLDRENAEHTHTLTHAHARLHRVCVFVHLMCCWPGLRFGTVIHFFHCGLLKTSAGAEIISPTWQTPSRSNTPPSTEPWPRSWSRSTEKEASEAACRNAANRQIEEASALLRISHYVASIHTGIRGN